MIHHSSVSIEAGYQNMYDDIAKLYNAVSEWDNPDHVDLNGDFFRNSYHQLNLDLQQNVFTARTEQHDLIGISTWREERANHEEAYLSGMVHPEFRRRGIGTRLLEQTEQMIMQQGIKLVTCNIPSYQEYSISFIEHRGFKRVINWLKLVHSNLDTIQKPERIQGLQIREMEAMDASTWANLQNQIFRGNFHYNDVSKKDFVSIRSRSDYDPELFLLGVVDGQPAAYCLGLVFKPAQENQEKRVIIQGIGVLPEFRGKGIGRAILEEVLWRAYQKNITRSELVVNERAVPARKMYERIGYNERYGRIWYSKDLYTDCTRSRKE